MSLFHLIYIVIFMLNFSGVPPATREEVNTEIITLPTELRKENDDFIPWLVQRKLAWEDFSAEPKRNTEAVASTSTSLGISYQVENGGLVYRITCNFAKHKSWGLLKTDYILAHEQGHFDITEIAARRLHGALSFYTFNKDTYRKDINDIYKAIVKEKEEMQADYDRQSDHSRNRRVQYEWQEKIKNYLEETAAWAEYP